MLQEETAEESLSTARNTERPHSLPMLGILAWLLGPAQTPGSTHTCRPLLLTPASTGTPPGYFCPRNCRGTGSGGPSVERSDHTDGNDAPGGACKGGICRTIARRVGKDAEGKAPPGRRRSFVKPRPQQQ
mmetsp:Transcript_4255/g.5884  ORF Transcript_4255/g.5884 Transcript_4255/m.5884 type:complete len:130 (+) Transcript_4255:355-744(+)